MMIFNQAHDVLRTRVFYNHVANTVLAAQAELRIKFAQVLLIQ